MSVLANRARMTTSTTGTGTITLGSAVAGFQSFADAGITNGQTVSYVIEDGNNWEVGTGTYTSSGTTLSRSVTESSNSDSAINLSGSAQVFIDARKEDLLVKDNNLSDVASASTAFSNIKQAATDAATGVVELAIQSEMEAGTDTGRAVVPGRQHYHPSAAKCWGYATVSGGTPTLSTSYNITSITDTATGRLTVTIATDFSSASYALVAQSSRPTTASAWTRSSSGTLAAGSFELSHTNQAGTLVDPEDWHWAAFGDQ